MRAWVLLSAVLWYLTGVGWQRNSERTEKGFIYGKPGHPVKVYVKLHHNSPVLVCMDFKRAEKETVDPTYLWVGPNEKQLSGSNRINITNTGKLTVKDFLEPLSGLYTCSFSYKTIKAETQEEKIVKQRYDFMIFEYIMRNAGLEEAQDGIKVAGRNINNLTYADDTTLMAESEEELKSLLMKEESEKVG